MVMVDEFMRFTRATTVVRGLSGFVGLFISVKENL
jgi:hypothetical protein